MLNSRNPLAKGLKAPLRSTNQDFWVCFLEEAASYISQLRDENKNLIIKSSRKTPTTGFLTAIESIRGLFSSLVMEKDSPLKYILTYKFSQDHLELFFGAVRSAGGCNNNPTARQFVAAYKRLLMRHEIQGGVGNCLQDNMKILYVTRDSASLNETRTTDILDVSLAKRYNIDLCTISEAHNEMEFVMDASRFCPALSQYKEAAIGYIAGYVVQMVKLRVHCPICTSSLEAHSNDTYLYGPCTALINRKNRGGLSKPSLSVIKICTQTEKCFQRILVTNKGKFPKAIGVVEAIASVVLNEISISAVFDDIHSHMVDSTPDNNHIFSLIKCISSCYSKIRMHHLAKCYTYNVTGESVRKWLSKLVLFKHQ